MVMVILSIIGVQGVSWCSLSGLTLHEVSNFDRSTQKLFLFSFKSIVDPGQNSSAGPQTSRTEATVCAYLTKQQGMSPRKFT